MKYLIITLSLIVTVCGNTQSYCLPNFFLVDGDSTTNNGDVLSQYIDYSYTNGCEKQDVIIDSSQVVIAGVRVRKPISHGKLLSKKVIEGLELAKSIHASGNFLVYYHIIDSDIKKISTLTFNYPKNRIKSISVVKTYPQSKAQYYTEYYDQKGNLKSIYKKKNDSTDVEHLSKNFFYKNVSELDYTIDYDWQNNSDSILEINCYVNEFDDYLLRFPSKNNTVRFHVKIGNDRFFEEKVYRMYNRSKQLEEWYLYKYNHNILVEKTDVFKCGETHFNEYTKDALLKHKFIYTTLIGGDFDVVSEINYEYSFNKNGDWISLKKYEVYMSEPVLIETITRVINYY